MWNLYLKEKLGFSVGEGFIYEEFDGWDTLAGARDYDSLPLNAKKYIEKIEEVTSVKVGIVSTSPERADTIIRG